MAGEIKAKRVRGGGRPGKTGGLRSIRRQVDDSQFPTVAKARDPPHSVEHCPSIAE